MKNECARGHRVEYVLELAKNSRFEEALMRELEQARRPGRGQCGIQHQDNSRRYGLRLLYHPSAGRTVHVRRIEMKSIFGSHD